MLKSQVPSLELEVQIIKTLGDRVTDVPLARFGDLGVFVKEIEAALLGGQIDIAVHSLKDVPSQETAGLVLTAFPEREDPRDVLVSLNGETFENLRPGARLGTSSARRRAQLRARRSDLDYRDDLRGNVDTRVRKLREGQYDAIVLAAAGLHRLGRAAEIAEYLPIEVCLPDAGQGILAVQTRQDDPVVKPIVDAIDNPRVRAQALAERAVLVASGGGCRVPVAAHARFLSSDDTLVVDALVARADGSRILHAQAAGPAKAASAIGQRLWADLAAQGGNLLLDEARDDHAAPG